MIHLNITLTSEERQDRYGHCLSEEKIRSLYPYEEGNLTEDYSEYTVTYDPLTAYSLRQRFPVLVWGKLKNNHRTFVFYKKKVVIAF